MIRIDILPDQENNNHFMIVKNKDKSEKYYITKHDFSNIKVGQEIKYSYNPRKIANIEELIENVE